MCLTRGASAAATPGTKSPPDEWAANNDRADLGGRLDVGDHRADAVVHSHTHRVRRLLASTREVDGDRGSVEPGDEAIPECAGSTAAVDQDEAEVGHDGRINAAGLYDRRS